MWHPQFACPECRGDVSDRGEVLHCERCGEQYGRTNGVWRFLTPNRGERIARFAAQYRAVRNGEGRTVQPPDYYRLLPNVPRDDPHAREWQVRRETYAHLLRRVLASGLPSNAVLDLGAGSGWLSHRLASLGHRVVAVDALDDDGDGLGAVRRYDASVLAVQADFDALPFAPGQFDLVIFNGSLHYAPDVHATLAEAHRMLGPNGAVVVMDSPMFAADGDGAAMVADRLRGFAVDFGIAEPVQAGRGYLTFASLAAAASALRLQAEFVPSRGPIGWRVRKGLARFRLGRHPAAFGLWVAR